MKVKHFIKGNRIITEGTIGTTMYFIDVGAARASINGITANELKSGEYYGEIAFVASCKKVLRNVDSNIENGDKSLLSSVLTLRQADVHATASSRMLELSVKDLLSVLKDDPTASHNVLSSLAHTSDFRLAHWGRIEKCIEKRNVFEAISLGKKALFSKP